MKKILVIAAALTLCAGFSFAQDAPEAPFTVTATTGAYYDAFPLDSSAAAIFEAIFNLRAGTGIDFEAALGGGLYAGAEIGFQGMYVEMNGTTTYVAFDLPLRGVVSFDMGPDFGLSAFGGVLWTVFLGSDFDGSLYLDAGGRITLGSVYIEASYEIPMSGFGFSPMFNSYSLSGGFFRVGVGSVIKLVK